MFKQLERYTLKNNCPIPEFLLSEATIVSISPHICSSMQEPSSAFHFSSLLFISLRTCYNYVCIGLEQFSLGFLLGITSLC